MRPDGLIARLERARQQSLNTSTAQDEPRIKIKQWDEEDVDPEKIEQMHSMLHAWEGVLKRKMIVKHKDLNSPTYAKVLSLLKTSDETDEVDGPEKRDGLDEITEAISEYLGQGYLSKIAPKQVHAILYELEEDDILFPKDKERSYLGFHHRTAGYPAIFWPLRRREDGQFAIQPLVLGHEIGEVLITEMERSTGGGIVGTKASNHFLKEGFCELIGLDFYGYFGKKNFPDLEMGTYDEMVFSGSFEQVSTVLSTGYSRLSSDDKAFAEYKMGGSFISYLSEKYGIGKIIEYFLSEASSEAVDDRIARTRFKSDRQPISVPPDKQMDEFLISLGYTRLDFEGAHASSKPFDLRPEGSIAAMVYTISHKMFEPRRLTVSSKLRIESEPTFLDRLIASIDTPQARKVFGPEFSAHTIANQWKEHILRVSQQEE